MFVWFLILFVGRISAEVYHYDPYDEKPISDEKYAQLVRDNLQSYCCTDFEPCKPYEGRRIDGTCNNFKHPIKGAPNTPARRLLPPVFRYVNGEFEPRKAVSGNDLPLGRYIRTSLLATGKVPSNVFTHLATHFLVFIVSDFLTIQDTVNYILWKPYCCEEKGKSDPECVPNEIPWDDPVHRFSGIRCINMTRPISLQYVGCLPKNTVPVRLQGSTHLYDLSNIYGISLESNQLKGRLFKGGLLKYEVEDERIWPPSYPEGMNMFCPMNEPNEKRCHMTPENAPNTLAGITLFSIWFWRMHNVIATKLSKINPCWSDDKIFYVARDINIAFEMQMYLYELLPTLMGRKNLIEDGLISPSKGFRDVYKSKIFPQMSLEFPYTLRYLHLMQEGTLKLYDPEGHYVKQISVVNMTTRSGYYSVDNNIDYITHGSYLQATGKVDYVVDNDMAELGLGRLQKTLDVFTNDLMKGRYLGFQPYTEYLKFYTGITINCFDDLSKFISPERIEMLKDVYENVHDIDLMAGMWLEKFIKGAFVPPTFYFIVVEQLLRNLVADRHWFESSKRPYAFTAAQLQEIRKMTVARMLCDVGDKVTQIQPKAFQTIGPGNRITQCSNIPKINFKAWKDDKCC